MTLPIPEEPFAWVELNAAFAERVRQAASAGRRRTLPTNEYLDV